MKLLSKNSTKQAAAQTAAEPSSAPVARKPKLSKKKLIILCAVAALAVLLAILAIWRVTHPEPTVDDLYTFTQVERRSITETLTGSGILEPADSYTVTTLIAEDILSAPFEDGDVVTKGDVLYELDSSNAATSIERAEIALSQTQRNYDKKLGQQADLYITAPISGTVSEFSIRAGDTVRSDTPVAVIENTSTLLITEYYSMEYKDQIYVGMPATVSIPQQMMNLSGSVREVSSLTRTSGTGILCFAVTVELSNPGSLSVGLEATCWLDGEIYPSVEDDNGLDASSRQIAYADVTGTAADICIRNGETVTAGTTLLRLSSDDLPDELLSAADALRDAELSLQTQIDALENYTVTAPIDGTIVDKYYKEGEKSEAGKPLCIIYDLSSLTLTLAVDELDIRLISVGQKATITADAVEGGTYSGVITRVGVNGTNTGGVTTYPVDIRIDKTDGLLPSMNADVTIVVGKAEKALSVPADAVERNDRILIRSEDGSTDEGAPEGYVYTQVETGVSDGDWVEILSGLEEGDEIAYIPASAYGLANDAVTVAVGGY